MQMTIIGKLSAQSIQAVQRLKSLAVGESVPVDEMSKLLGLDCGTDGSGRPKVANAIKRLRKHDQINIRWDKNAKAWKRTDDAETAVQTDDDRKRTRRVAMRGIERSKCVAVANLTDEERSEFRATSTQLVLATIATDNETRKKLPKSETVIDTDRLLLSIRPVAN